MEPPKAARFRRALVVANPKAKLFDQVSEVCRLLHYSRRTEQTYVGWIRRFLVFHRTKAAGQWRHPRELGGQEVTEFLSHLAVAEQVSASTQNQALNPVVFLYREVLHRELTGLDERLRATRPKRLPVVLAQEEVLVEKEIGGGDGALEISVALVFSRRLTIKGGGFTCGMGCGSMTVEGMRIFRLLVLSLVLVSALIGCGKKPEKKVPSQEVIALAEKAAAGDAKALAVLRGRAEEGDAEAQASLGAMYFIGEGVPKDMAEAFKWFILASAEGDESAKKTARFIEKRITAEERAEGEKRAREFEERSKRSD